MDDLILGSVLQSGGVLKVRPDDSVEPLHTLPKVPKGVTLAPGDRVLLFRKNGWHLIVARY